MKNTFKNLRKKLVTLGMVLVLISSNIVTAQAASNNNGWVRNNGVWSYYTKGVKKTGWVNDRGNWYLLNSEGTMETGWVSINGAWYYLNPNGTMKTGWLLDNGNWYYLNGSGDMKTGWFEYEGNLYYLLDNGVMAKNTFIEGKTINNDGIAVTVGVPAGQFPDGDPRNAGEFNTSEDRLVTLKKGGGYESNLGRLNGMVGNTYGKWYMPYMTQDGMTGGLAKFSYDKKTDRYGLEISGWRHDYNTHIGENGALNVILESFYFFCGDKDVAKSLWKWFDAKNINGYANTDDFGFTDIVVLPKGATIEKNGIKIDVSSENGVTTVYFH